MWRRLPLLPIALAVRAECPPIEPPQAPLEEPIREGVVRVIPVRSGPVYACWLREGADAYRKGDLAAAGRGYRMALRLRPQGTEALLGLAAVAVAEGRPRRAIDHYRRVLRNDPGNPRALAGLAQLMPDPDGRLQAILERLAQRHPEHAALHFALGVVHVRRDDWPRAQQAFFAALRRAPEQPDYAFNLAVALDHLGKPRLAARYYETALRLARIRPARFDEAAARRRLQALTESPP